MKLIGVDYDGTLYWPDHQITPENLAMIKRLRSDGHKFAIVSGRSLLSLKFEAKKYGFECDYYVGDNGAIITDGDFKLIEKHNIEIADAQALFSDLKAVDCLSISIDNGMEAGSTDAKYFQKYQDYPNLSCEDILKQNDVVSIKVAFNTFLEAFDFSQIVNEKYSNITAYPNIKAVDICLKGISKATGIEKLMELTQAEEVYVIGDGHNDISMVEQYQGYTMEHGCAELKVVAKEVFKDLRGFEEAIYER
ncbi:MAG: HAD family hydrolase [Erysipelotrichaceae bacterium]